MMMKQSTINNRSMFWWIRKEAVWRLNGISNLVQLAVLFSRRCGLDGETDGVFRMGGDLEM